MIRTWSLESAFFKAYTTAAVAVQGLIDAAHTVEQLTRPVRRDVRDGDYEAVSPDGYYGYAEPNLDGADQLADKEAEEDVTEPAFCHQELRPNMFCVLPDGHDGGHEVAMYGLTADSLVHLFTETDPTTRKDHLGPYHHQGFDDYTPHPTGGSIYDDEYRYPPNPDWHNATDNLCVYARAEDLGPLAICGVCRPVRDIVEQMIEERFGSQVDKADKLDAEMWRAVVGMYSKMDPQSTPAASAAGSSSPAACDIPPVARRGVPPWSDLADRMVEHLPSAKELPDEDYRPLYGEKRCATCGYWRGQHVAEDYSDDSNLCCPLWDSATTFTPLDRNHLK